MDNAIEINNLTKTYHDFQLKNLSMTLPQGCIMGLIGENGAGKTTTLKAMLDIIRRDGGSVQILGKNIDTDDKEIKEQIGVVFDECSFHDHLRPKEISAIMARVYKKWDDSLFMKYCRSFQLPEDKQVKDYSRGMKMKICIAVALAHHPKLLILDEATSGLDPVARDEILDIFYDFIQEEDHTILLSSHITSDLDKIADYITFIHGGEVIFSKSKTELIEDMGVVKCGSQDFAKLERRYCLRYRKGQFGCEVLIQDKDSFRMRYPNYIVDPVTIEEIMLFYIRGNVA